MKNFAITGVAGYIAPRHLQAIKDMDIDLEQKLKEDGLEESIQMFGTI